MSASAVVSELGLVGRVHRDGGRNRLRRVTRPDPGESRTRARSRLPRRPTRSPAEATAATTAHRGPAAAPRRSRRARAPTADPRTTAAAPARRRPAAPGGDCSQFLHLRRACRAAATCGRAASASAPSRASTSSVLGEMASRFIVVALLQHPFQVRQRVEEVRFDRADRAAENRGDLLVRQLVVHAKDHRGALFPGQPGDRGANRCGPLLPQHVAIGPLRRGVLMLARSIGSITGGFDRHAIEADVDRDAIQPGAEGRVPLERAQRAVRAHERVLREIAGVFVIADEPVADLIDLSAMALDQHVERAVSPARHCSTSPRVVSPVMLGPRMRHGRTPPVRVTRSSGRAIEHRQTYWRSGG